MAENLDSFYPFDNGAGAAVAEAQWREMARRWLQSGVLRHTDDDMTPIADSTGMQVKVRTGKVWIRGHFGSNDSQKTLAIAAADPSNDRIDRVVVRLDTVGDVIELDVLTGTPAGSPAPPSLTRTASAWEISLAQVLVPAEATTITAGNVTDERRNGNLCGMIHESVPALLVHSSTKPSEYAVGGLIYEVNNDRFLVNTGSFGTPSWADVGVTNHANLSNVTANQHHARQHALDSGSDHTGTVGTTQIANLAVIDGKLAANAVTTAKIANLAVTDDKLAANAVTTAKIANLAVTDGKVAAANKDGAAGTASMRTLGTGATQAAAGNHTHTLQQHAVSGVQVDDAGGPDPGDWPLDPPRIAGGGSRNMDHNLSVSKTCRVVGVAACFVVALGSNPSLPLQLFIDGVEISSTTVAQDVLRTVSGTREVASGTRQIRCRVESPEFFTWVRQSAGGGAISL